MKVKELTAVSLVAAIRTVAVSVAEPFVLYTEVEAGELIHSTCLPLGCLQRHMDGWAGRYRHMKRERELVSY